MPRDLPTLDPSVGHAFIEPCKRIHESQDVSAFLTSKAYVDLMTFILQLNRSMFPVKQTGADGPSVQTWPLNSDAVEFSAPVRQCQLLLSKLEAILEEAPPDTGPRRFGNVSFRKWFQIVESRADQLLEECLVPEVLGQKLAEGSTTTAKEELKAYFLGSWGSAQRLDYGTGHELSFLAFLGGMWKLNGFPKNEAGVEERAIVIGVIQPYLDLIRTIIRRYTLEPAGSHGVWGLDDHSFIPYILGAAQLAQPMVPGSETLPEEGSLPDAPDPGGVAKANIVERERKTNMYFAAVGFIYDVKRGPFWEHSPMLFDISGVRAGWAKINKGMLKMYNAEVLSKFPVVQHFPFGSLFSFDRDPNAVPPTQQPQSQPTQRPGPAQESRTTPGPGTTMPTGMPTGTAAPWATSARGPIASVPETTRFPAGSMPSTRAPGPGAGDGAPTKAPWAK